MTSHIQLHTKKYNGSHKNDTQVFISLPPGEWRYGEYKGLFGLLVSDTESDDL